MDLSGVRRRSPLYFPFPKGLTPPRRGLVLPLGLPLDLTPLRRGLVLPLGLTSLRRGFVLPLGLTSLRRGLVLPHTLPIGVPRLWRGFVLPIGLTPLRRGLVLPLGLPLDLTPVSPPAIGRAGLGGSQCFEFLPAHDASFACHGRSPLHDYTPAPLPCALRCPTLVFEPRGQAMSSYRNCSRVEIPGLWMVLFS